jgi:hypothetical protein
MVLQASLTWSTCRPGGQVWGRSELVVDPTRRLGRLRELLCSDPVGLERVTDATRKVSLALLSRWAPNPPIEIRIAGAGRTSHHLLASGHQRRDVVDCLVEATVAAAQRQQLTVLAEQVAAAIVKDLAREALDVRAKIDALDGQIAERPPPSRSYYDRKRREGKAHRQAVIALARRRVSAFHAILRSRQPYQPRPATLPDRH